MAVPLSIWEDRLKSLRSLGVNAIRTAHQIRRRRSFWLCATVGLSRDGRIFRLLDASAKIHSTIISSFPNGRTTTSATRFCATAIIRASSSISVGNEILDTPNAAKAKKILTGLVAVAHAADPTRPVTQALFRPNASGDYTNGLADLLDVVGQNYREKEILAAHEQKPSRKILGTENTHDRNQWLAVRDHAPYAGQFLVDGR